MRALIDADVTDACFGPMVDGEAAQALRSAKIGDRVHKALGPTASGLYGSTSLARRG